MGQLKVHAMAALDGAHKSHTHMCQTHGKYDYRLMSHVEHAFARIVYGK